MAIEYGTESSGTTGTYGGANEGRTTSMLEAQTSRAPSLTWLGLAVGSMAASALLMLSGRKQLANFIGQWAPTLLIIGVYNKLAKETGAPQRYGHA